MADKQDAPTIDVVWPSSPRQQKVRSLAKRPASLDKVRIGFLWDYVFRGDEIFAILQEGLRERFPNVEFVSYEVFGSTHAENEREVVAALPGKFKELGVTAVISGMGC